MARVTIEFKDGTHNVVGDATLEYVRTFNGTLTGYVVNGQWIKLHLPAGSVNSIEVSEEPDGK